jgi:hypothetical protein
MGTHIHIRDFDSKLHAELVRRAQKNGQSLAEYLRRELTKLAARPDLDELAAQLKAMPHPQISRAIVQQALAESRAEREKEPLGFYESQMPLKP